MTSSLCMLPFIPLHFLCGVVLDWVVVPPKRGTAPSQFSVYVYCGHGQTAGWIKTPRGTEVDLSLGHIVLDWDPAPPRKGHRTAAPLFLAHVLWPWSPISATAELLLDFSMMAAVRHLGFVMRVFGPCAEGIWWFYHCAKMGWNRGSSFDNMQV